MINFTNEDCMEMMSRAGNKQYDLAIVDPPVYIISAANLVKYCREAEYKQTVPTLFDLPEVKEVVNG